MSLRSRLRALEIATRPEHPDLDGRARARAGRSCRRTSRRPTRCSAGARPAARARTACSRAATSPAPRATTRARPTACASTATTRVTEVDAQMALLRALRGPGQNAQLIGGEVTLLAPDDHAAALQAMHRPRPQADEHVPRRLRLRLPRAARARPAHRRAALRPPLLRRALRLDDVRPPRDQARARARPSCNPYRARFCEHVPAARARARRHALPRAQHDGDAAQPRPGRRSVIRDCRDMGFRMFSFQPAAFIGNRAAGRTTTARSRPTTCGRRSSAAPARGCTSARCRSATSAATAPPTAPTSATATCRCSTRTTRATGAGSQDFIAAFGGMDFEAPPALLAARLARGFARHPRALPRRRRLGAALRARAPAAPRTVARAPPAGADVRDARVHGRARRAAGVGGAAARRALRRPAHPRDPGAPAGVLLRDGPPGGRARSCPPAPSTRVLDPEENLALQRLLPLERTSTAAGSEWGSRSRGGHCPA